MKHFLLVLLTIASIGTLIVTLKPAKILATGEFITTWKTDNPGVSNSDQITIPTHPGLTYNYTVDWGDATTNTGVTGDITHTYASPGIYTVQITGLFPAIYFNDGGDKAKILTVEQWGANAWETMENAFYGSINLTVTAVDTPNLLGVTNMSNMFRRALAFNQPVNNWNVSNVTNMSGMFAEAVLFNQPVDNWDVGNVTNMSAMFAATQYFDQPVNSWDTSSVTDMSGMFYGATSFNQSLDNWDVSNVTDMYGLFFNSNMSTANYDQTLISWAGQILQPNVTLSAEPTTYCEAVTARDYIITTFGWTIADGGLTTCSPSSTSSTTTSPTSSTTTSPTPSTTTSPSPQVSSGGGGGGIQYGCTDPQATNYQPFRKHQRSHSVVIQSRLHQQAPLQLRQQLLVLIIRS